MQDLATLASERAAPETLQTPLQLGPGPLFVVGMFRSGTSLLYALLNQHPQIALMYEDDLPHLRSLFWLRRDTASWLKRWNFWNGAPARHKFDGRKLPAGLRDLRSAALAVYREYARQKKGATVWGCKSPTYHDEILRLSRTFPNARFVIIWRDLTSICRSVLKAAQEPTFFRRKGMLLRVLLGYHEMKLQCDSLTARGVPVYQIHYEELVRDPAATMQGICQFLEISYDPRMTSLQGADRSAIEDCNHHSLVKSERIVPARKNASTLLSGMERKVNRYVFRWREQYQGAWPVYPESLNGTTAGPSMRERFRDRVAYTMLSFWHHAAPVVFSFVPLWLWERYRKVIDAKRYPESLDGSGSRLE
jgi:sulfotransferase family protein